MGKRNKVNLFLLEISTAENCSRAGRDLKDITTRTRRWSLYWMKPQWTQHVYVIFQYKLCSHEASCFLKNTNTEQLLVVGLEVYSGLYPVTNSHESVKGSKNKVRTNKTKPLSIHLSTASKLGAWCWWKCCSRARAEALEAGLCFVPLDNLQVSECCFLASVLSAKWKKAFSSPLSGECLLVWHKHTA